MGRRKREEKEQKARDVKEGLIKDSSEMGLWSVADIPENITSLSQTKAKEMLKAQIGARKTLLHCVPTEKLAISKATVLQLSSHLENLLGVQLTQEDAILESYLQDPLQLLGKDIQHLWVTDQEEVVFHGNVIEMKDREFGINYAEEGTVTVFLTKSETLTDMANGDLKVL